LCCALRSFSEEVDLDINFVNRMATELQYLVWVLKGDYEKNRNN